MSSTNKRIGLPVEVQENIIQNIQRIFPNTVNKELIRTVLIKEDWDLEKSLQFLHRTLSSFNKDNTNVSKSNKKNKASNQVNNGQSQQNVNKLLSKPQKQQKKLESVVNSQNQNKKKVETGSMNQNQKKPDLFKKSPGVKQKSKGDQTDQGDWVLVENPQAASAQLSSKNDDKPASNESKIARRKQLIQCYDIIKHFGEPVNRISAYIKEGIKVMVLLRGCSGSGKTTYANQLLQKEGSKNPENHIFSTDRYFIQPDGAYCFNQYLLQEAHEWNQKLVQLAILEGRSPVFVDNTNSRLWEMREYAVMAVKYGYVLETLEPPTPWFFNEDILFRKTNHSVPRETIRNMLDRYEANLSGEDVIRNLQLNYLPHLTPPQGVTAGLETPMSKSHKKMLGRRLNDLLDGMVRSNEVKSKINMAMPQQTAPLSTYLKGNVKGESVKTKNWSHLTGRVAINQSNETQNSNPFSYSSASRMVSSVGPYDKPSFVPSSSVAAPTVNFGVSSRAYEFLSKNNLEKSKEQMSEFAPTVDCPGIGEFSNSNSAKLVDISNNEIVNQQKEEVFVFGATIPTTSENLHNAEENVSDSYDSDSEPEDMTSNSSVTSDESEQGDENVNNISCTRYENNLEYVLVSDDNRITFQKCHSEMKDIITLEAFKETFSGSAAVASNQFEDYLMEFIETSGKEIPPPVIPAEEKAEYSFQTEQVRDLPPTLDSQTADSSTATGNPDFEMLQQVKSGSDNWKKNVLIVDLNSAPDAQTSSLAFPSNKVSSTSDNNVYEKHAKSSPIDTLHKLFPKVSRENLVEIFGSGQVDIDWAVDLLLDSGQEMDASKTSEVLPATKPNAGNSLSFLEEQGAVSRDQVGAESVGPNNPSNTLSEQMGQSFSEFLQGNEGISCSSSGQFSQNSKRSLWSNNQMFSATENKGDAFAGSSSQNNHSLGAIKKNSNCIGDWDYTKEIPKPMPVETPKLQRNVSPRLCSKTSITTNTNYADFETLRKVNSNEENACHDLSKILMGNPGFVSVSNPYFPCSSVLMLEKGTMTSDIETNQIEKMESGVERLALMFPRVSRENLEELFEKCQKDIDWAAGLLLDSGQEMSELYASLETLECSTSEKNKADKDEEPMEQDQDKTSSEKKQRRRKRIRHSKSDNDVHEELQKQFQNNFVLNESHYSSEHMKKHFQKKNPNKINLNENEEITKSMEGTEDDESNNENVADFEEEIVFMLDSDFILQLQSRFGGLLRPNMLREKTVVNLPLSLARQLHSYVMDSVQQHIQEENIFTDEDEEYARALQEEENRARGAPSLLEIMDEEVALRETQKESTNGRSMASALSKQLLLERFPKMDPTTLASILDDTNHSLHQATFVLSSAGHELAEPDILVESPPEEEKSTLSREEAIKQADAYVDVSSQLYDLRKDCLRKSQKAYREGNHSVALYYSDMARWYMERIEKSNSMAAKAILTGYEGWTTLDLHFLQVSEALNVLDLFVDEVIRDLQSSNDRRAIVYIITGRGIHSSGGRPRLKPAVISRLIKRDLRFAEQNPGMLRVTIPRTALTSYKQKIETTA